jgi:hypothetical protein
MAGTDRPFGVKGSKLTEIVAFYFYMTLRNWGQVNQMHG